MARVACCGDSNTGWSDESINYPVKLQKNYLDEIIRNFGEGGCAASKSTPLKSYWDTQIYLDAKAFNADYVLMMFGTVDAVTTTWAIVKDDFVPDYKDLISQFTGKVFIAKPPPVWESRQSIILETTIDNEVLPKIVQIASESGATLLDAYTPVKNISYFQSDGIHLNDAGFTVLKNVFKNALASYLSPSPPVVVPDPVIIPPPEVIPPPIPEPEPEPIPMGLDIELSGALIQQAIEGVTNADDFANALAKVIVDNLNVQIKPGAIIKQVIGGSYAPALGYPNTQPIILEVK